MLLVTCSFSSSGCDAQHHTGKLKERRGAIESPACHIISLCQGQQGLVSLLPSSWDGGRCQLWELAEILKQTNPPQLRSNI